MLSKILSAAFLIGVGILMIILEHDATCLVMFGIFALVILVPDKPRKKNTRYNRKEYDNYG